MKPVELVDLKRGRVHMHAYSETEVFRQEMRRIFYQTWVFIGHESEVAFPGDYKTTYVGLVPVILARDEDGGLNVMVNRCAHRGTTVCQREKGNANYFKCEYHGWVYSNRGDLTGISLRRGYGADEAREAEIGLQRLSRVDSYQGLVFASFNADVESLDDFLGLAKPYIDDWAKQSPDGELSVQSGSHYQFEYNGNWKLQAENNTEGYHPDFLHQEAVRVQIYNSQRSRAAAGKEERTRTPRIAAMQARGRDLGNGHNIVETPQVSLILKRRYPQEFIAALESAYGPGKVDSVVGPPWRLTIFPNLSIGGSNIRVIYPFAANQTMVRQYFVDLPTAPDAVRDLRHEQEQSFYGPAGYGGPDDVEMFERMQEGFSSADADVLNPWVLFNRALATEEVGPNGELVADSTSEITQRSVYRGWHKYMSAGG
jgi:phenylpropionate dioxygenase-like ring-hydroxylating dioxygenase large terminal subunit